MILHQLTTRRVRCALLGLMLQWLMPMSATAASESVYDWPYVFTDEQGHLTRLDRWRGHTVLVTMEYATCQLVCSAALTKLRQVQQLAARRQLPVELLIISLDPDHDSPDAWRRYRRQRNLTESNWFYLTPRAADLPTIAARLGTRYWYDGALLMHDFRILSINPQGHIDRTLDSFVDNVSILLDTTTIK